MVRSIAECVEHWAERFVVCVEGCIGQCRTTTVFPSNKRLLLTRKH
jgi:hypothetical protein